jgi:hypothetical protein
MQKIKTYFNKNNFSFETLFYSEHSGTFTKKKHKTLNKLIKFSGFITLFLIIATLFLLSSCKEEQIEPITDVGSSILEVYKKDTNNLKMFIFKQQKLFN